MSNPVSKPRPFAGITAGCPTAICRARRRARQGANLAVLCALIMLILGFMGIAIYTGLQAFVESDLQRAGMNAAMAAAAGYYGDADTTGKPTPNAASARNIAVGVFNTISDNSSLRGFNPTATITSNDNNDSVTIDAKASIATTLLAPTGISSIELHAQSTARALRYEPTLFTGPVYINPIAGDIGTYSKIMQLAFPLVDGKGGDIYIEQDATKQIGYVVEACNETECYNLLPGATVVGSSRILTVNGVPVIYGTVMIDLAKAAVRKASKLRFTFANSFNYYNQGAGPTALAASDLVEGRGLPLIRRVMIFGYSGACVSPANCPIPAGFSPVEL